MRFVKIKAIFLTIGLVSVQEISVAGASEYFHVIESKPLEEVWLTPGFYSYHFEKDKNLDNNDIGVGLEYRYSTVNSITAGRFHNSDRQMSDYAAWYWQPIALGPVRFGALIGLINGYPKAFDGNWFPLALPVASIEYKSFGLSLTVVPTYKETLHGSISVQFKLKLF